MWGGTGSWLIFSKEDRLEKIAEKIAKKLA